MANIKKQGFGPWKKTIVEHNGQQDVYSGNAEVQDHGDTVCVTERGFFTEKSVCYLDDSSDKKSSTLPDGQLVGKSKSIALQTHGDTKQYESGILSVNSLEKNGDEIHVVQNGLFGKKVIDKLDANSIEVIESEDCNVCKGINPVYKGG